MKKFLTSLILGASLFVAAIPVPVRAATGDARIIVENADGTYSEFRVTFAAGKLLAFDAVAGTFKSVDPATFAPAASVPITKSGTQAFTLALGTTKAITFASALPAGSTYVVHVQGQGFVTSGWGTNQTLTGFTLNIPVAVLGTVGWDIETITSN